MKITTLIPLALIASLAASAAVQADETSTPPKTPTETNQPMMGNGSQGMQGMMGMMSQMQQMMESCNQMMKASNERHDKQDAPKQKDRHGWNSRRPIIMPIDELCIRKGVHESFGLGINRLSGHRMTIQVGLSHRREPVTGPVSGAI